MPSSPGPGLVSLADGLIPMAHELDVLRWHTGPVRPHAEMAHARADGGRPEPGAASAARTAVWLPGNS
jgi:hypothetical protein